MKKPLEETGDQSPEESPEELIVEASPDAPQRRSVLRHMPLSEIVPGNNPRRKFEEQAMRELTNSVRMMGVIEPIVVRPAYEDLTDAGAAPINRFVIIAGERRYRAAKLAGLDEVPVIIKFVSGVEALEMTMAENLDREELDPIEEARGLRDLLDRGRTQQQLGERLHKSQPWINNRLRLLKLPVEVQDMISDRLLAPSAGVSLVSIDEYPEKIMELAREAVASDWTIKDIDAHVSSFKTQQEVRRQPRMELEPELEPESDNSPNQAISPNEDEETVNAGVKFIEPGPAIASSPIAPPPDESSTETEVNVPTTRSVPSTVRTADIIEPAATVTPDSSPSVTSSASVPAKTSPSPSRPAETKPASSKAPEPVKPPEPPKPSLPPGFVNGLLKKEDLDALQADGLWPLAKIREEIHRLHDAPDSDAAPAPPSPPPTSLAGALITPPVITSALRLAEINRTIESVFTEAEADILNELFPVRETTTPAHVIAVLVVSRFRGMERALAKRALAEQPPTGEEDTSDSDI